MLAMRRNFRLSKSGFTSIITKAGRDVSFDGFVPVLAQLAALRKRIAETG